MSVFDLNRDQFLELKQAYLCEQQQNVSWDALANADEYVSDDQVFALYADVNFSPEDF